MEKLLIERFNRAYPISKFDRCTYRCVSEARDATRNWMATYNEERLYHLLQNMVLSNA